MRLLPHWAEPELTRQFVVDERPEPIYPASDLPEGVQAVAEADLLTLVARVMVENERLVELTDRLERQAGAGSDQEVLRLAKSLLPVLDSFDRVLEMGRGFEATEVFANWLVSIESIQSRLTQTLMRLGLEPLDPLGQEVDLDRDEVVEVRATRETPSNRILEVRRKGYRFRGKMIRDAQVVVAQNPRRG
jgi:molecular chaperone GrpE